MSSMSLVYRSLPCDSTISFSGIKTVGERERERENSLARCKTEECVAGLGHLC